MKLTEKYAANLPEELPLLFQRILQNTIRDYYRRQKTRSLWTTLFSSFTPSSQEKGGEDYDLLETLQVKTDSDFGNDPHAQLEQSQLISSIEEAIKTGEGKAITTTSVGKNDAGEIVAEFFITWSFKAKSIT